MKGHVTHLRPGLPLGLQFFLELFDASLKYNTRDVIQRNHFNGIDIRHVKSQCAGERTNERTSLKGYMYIVVLSQTRHRETQIVSLAHHFTASGADVFVLQRLRPVFEYGWMVQKVSCVISRGPVANQGILFEQPRRIVHVEVVVLSAAFIWELCSACLNMNIGFRRMFCWRVCCFFHRYCDGFWFRFRRNEFAFCGWLGCIVCWFRRHGCQDDLRRFRIGTHRVGHLWQTVQTSRSVAKFSRRVANSSPPNVATTGYAGN